MAGEKIAGLIGAAGGLGNIAQTGFAAGQMISGAMSRKKADAMLPPSESPMERQLLNTYRRRRRALETGTAGASDRASLRQTLAQFGQNSFRAGGGVNTGVLNQLRTQGMKNISDQYGQQYMEALKGEGDVAMKIADVGRDISFLRSARESARGAQLEQAGTQNLLATLGSGKAKKENESLKKQLAAYQNQGQ